MTTRHGTLLAAAVFVLLVVLRFITASQHWQWFDEQFPGLWENSRTIFSQDGSHYITQADEALRHGGPVWADDAFFRPPLPSFYFQYLFELTHFDLVRVSWLQSTVALFTYLLLFLMIRHTAGNGIAVCSLLVMATHSVLVFYDTSIEDSTIASLFLTAGIYPLLRYSTQLRRQHIVMSGIMLAMATMCRPNIGLMIFFIAIWLFRQLRKPTNGQPVWGPQLPLSRSIQLFALPLAFFLLLSMIYAHSTGASSLVPRYAFGTTARFGGPEYALFAALLISCGSYLAYCHRSDRDSFSIISAGFCMGIAGFLCRDTYLPGILATVLFIGSAPRIAAETPVKTMPPAAARRSLALTLFSLPLLAIIALCAGHNYNELRKLSLITSTFGENIYWGNNPNQDYRITMQGEELERWLVPAAPHTRHYMHLIRQYPEHNSDDSHRKAAFAFMASNPAETLQYIAQKFHRSFANFEFPRNIDISTLGVSATVLQWWHIPYGAMFGLALGYMLLGRKQRHDSDDWLLFIPALALIATETIFFNASRYRSVGLPFLIPLAVMGAHLLWQTLRRQSWGHALALTALTALFVQIGNTATDATLRNKYHSVSLYKLARMQLVQDGTRHTPGTIVLRDPPLFMRRLDEALALFPQNIAAFYLREMYLVYSAGRPDQARQEISAYRQNCSNRDFVCSDTLTALEKIAADPGRYISEGPILIEQP